MFYISHSAHDSSNGGTKAVSVTATLLLQYFFFLSINAALSTVSVFPCFCICKKTLFKKRQIFAWLCFKLGVSHAAIKGNGNYSQVYIYHINK